VAARTDLVKVRTETSAAVAACSPRPRSLDDGTDA